MNTTNHPPYRFAPFLPLIAVGVEVIWLLMLLFALLFIAGDQPYTMTTAQERLGDILALIPAGAGLILGLLGIILGSAQRTREWICLFLGTLGCALFTFSFGWEFIQGFHS